MKKEISTLAVIFFCVLQGHSQLNTSFLGQINYAEDCSNLWGWNDGLGHEYVIIGTYSGTRIVDVTDPTDPDELFFIDGANSIWREVKTWDHYAYVVTEGNGDGLLCIDLSGLPATINYNFSDGGIGLDDAHTVTTDENGFVHVFGSDFATGGDIILDANTTPLDPTYAGQVDDWYIHDGFVRGDTLWAANIYQGWFSVFDISNKLFPELLATQTTPKNFTHNTALSNNGKYLFTTDETTNAPVGCYDVSDLSDINLIKEFRANPGTNSIPHNTYVLENFLITSWYRDGIIISDISHPDFIFKTGYYDSSPAYSGSGFNGAWGVYPYFPSGTIAISDIENGLILIDPTYVGACFLEGNITDDLTGSSIFDATISITADAASLVHSDYVGKYLTGTLNSGTYTISCSKAGYLTKTITGVVLNSVSTTNLNIALESITPTCIAPVILTTSGITSTSAILNWNNVGATSYTVSYRKTSGGVTTNINAFDNTVNLSGLSTCTSYKWKVKAKCPGGSKPISVWVNFSTTGDACRNQTQDSFMIDQQEFEVYPNPLNRVLFIEGEISQPTMFSVYDFQGKLVLKEEIEVASLVELDLEFLNNGVYILQISNEQGTSNFSFVKD